MRSDDARDWRCVNLRGSIQEVVELRDSVSRHCGGRPCMARCAARDHHAPPAGPKAEMRSAVRVCVCAQSAAPSSAPAQTRRRGGSISRQCVRMHITLARACVACVRVLLACAVPSNNHNNTKTRSRPQAQPPLCRAALPFCRVALPPQAPARVTPQRSPSRRWRKSLVAPSLAALLC